MSDTLSARRLIALPQLAAWLLALGLGFEVSACPPGMDMGMDMPMPVGVGAQSLAGGTTQPADCPFNGTGDDQGRPNCPLAVGGIGTCGTDAPTSGESIVVSVPVSAGAPELVTLVAWRPDASKEIQLPPPRT